MFRKKECVAMLLAGGQGSRLYALTEKNAKPAVPFGGKYRIIDFTLSNCINSGFDTVGVLTQYQPLVLNDYIGNGLPWDLDRSYGGVKILPPYQGKKGADWYRGTANAIYQNMQFIDRYDSEYVLILSGDHIYKMDYAKMLDYHKRVNADCTIAVIDVPLKEASRFGIMSTEEDGKIYKFSEKPKNPDSTKASMGIYIFSKEVLFEFLTADAADPESSNDFGKNVIPAMLAAKKRMYAYPFSGYWKDVGTISSLWEANMDLLGETPKLDLRDEEWRIYSRHETHAPQFVGESAVVDNSSITEGCEIYGTVRNSVLGAGVCVQKGAVVSNSVIMDNVMIEKDAKINYAIIDEETTIGAGASIGSEQKKAKGITVIAAGLSIPEHAVVGDNEMISDIAQIQMKEEM
ncbi:MAG: glucose-1-phosphate adenylyltransferase [Clostridia bacterium]|nr:glucose-1-phosphate adenylyltransferase [Clostridia bacterium]